MKVESIFPGEGGDRKNSLTGVGDRRQHQRGLFGRMSAAVLDNKCHHFDDVAPAQTDKGLAGKRIGRSWRECTGNGGRRGRIENGHEAIIARGRGPGTRGALVIYPCMNTNACLGRCGGFSIGGTLASLALLAVVTAFGLPIATKLVRRHVDEAMAASSPRIESAIEDGLASLWAASRSGPAGEQPPAELPIRPEYPAPIETLPEPCECAGQIWFPAPRWFPGLYGDRRPPFAYPPPNWRLWSRLRIGTRDLTPPAYARGR
jgi:hypothetical protein